MDRYGNRQFVHGEIGYHLKRKYVNIFSINMVKRGGEMSDMPSEI